MNTSDKSDRELLELAAKAAGYRYRISNDWHDAGSFYVKEDDRRAFEQYWNPLADDGDALRLAVSRRQEIILDASLPFVAVYDEGETTGAIKVTEPLGNDHAAATRRAIVRAAAAIGAAS